MAFSDYSTVPAANTTIGDGVFIGPNMERNKVRQALQQLAADGKGLHGEMQALLSLPQGPMGPAGTASNNSGIITTATTGTGPAPTKAAAITTGAGANDLGINVDMLQGALSGLTIHKDTAGYFLMCVAKNPGEEGLVRTYIGDGGDYRTRMWMVISGTVTDNGLARSNPSYRQTIQPASSRRNMFGIHADLELCMELRPPGVGDQYVLLSGMDGDGKEHFAIGADKGELRWSFAGVQTGNHTNGGDTTQTSTFLSLRLAPIDERTLYLYSENVATYGEAHLLLQDNGAIVGLTTLGARRNLVKFEASNVAHFGDEAMNAAVDATQIDLNAPITNLDGALRLKSYTVTDLNAGIKEAGRIAFASDETGGPTMVYADGTNWRRVYDNAVIT